MKKIIKTVSIFLLTASITSLASAADITPEELKSFSGLYTGKTMGGSDCRVEVTVKSNKIGFKVSSDDIELLRRGQLVKMLPSLSSKKVDLTKFAEGSWSVGYGYGYVSYSEQNKTSLGDKVIRVDYHEKSLTSVLLSNRVLGLFNFFEPAREEVEAYCLYLVKANE